MTVPPTPGAASASAAGDPSMEDILASIRRILSEDEGKPDNASPPADSAELNPADDDVVQLDSSMMVRSDPVAEPALPAEVPIPAQAPQPLAPLPALVAPEAAAAAASSVENLVRTLSTARATMVTSQGPTIEDIVRQEIRPLLKGWLDANLPPLVERLVRTELERIVVRART